VADFGRMAREKRLNCEPLVCLSSEQTTPSYCSTDVQYVLQSSGRRAPAGVNRPSALWPARRGQSARALPPLSRSRFLSVPRLSSSFTALRQSDGYLARCLFLGVSRLHHLSILVVEWSGSISDRARGRRAGKRPWFPRDPHLGNSVALPPLARRAPSPLQKHARIEAEDLGTTPSYAACFPAVFRFFLILKMSSAARVSGAEWTAPPAPSAGNDDERLLWSKDPEECWLSDWKIEISVGGESAIYNVHRAFLVSGTKRSDYFVRLFKNENFAESKQRTSRIVDLNQQALKAFPLVLDYLYDLAMHEKMVRENTAALYHLADYLGVDKLAEEIKEFWDRTMKVTECEFYFEQAKLFRIDYLMELVVHIFSSSIDLVTPTFDDSPSLPIFDSQFWLDVAKLRTGKWNPKLSKLVTDFCWKEQDALDAETFVKLTSVGVLPIGSISFHSAVQLLKLEKKFLPSGDTNELTDLQTRCLEALSRLIVIVFSVRRAVVHFIVTVTVVIVGIAAQQIQGRRGIFAFLALDPTRFGRHTNTDFGHRSGVKVNIGTGAAISTKGDYRNVPVFCVVADTAQEHVEFVENAFPDSIPDELRLFLKIAVLYVQSVDREITSAFNNDSCG